MLSCPHWPHRHRICVIAKRLGCLHRLAHAAGHGHFQGASTSGRTFDPVHLRKPRYKKLARVSPETVVTCQCYNACFPPRRADLAQWCHGKIMHKAFVSCNRCRFVHHSDFRRHGMVSAKNFFPETATFAFVKHADPRELFSLRLNFWAAG